jgi:paraquat-inducible protein B
MGRKANPALIGAFVVGAVALAVAGVLAFGSGRFFKRTTPFVLYFPGSVDGLAIGAPVKFKGVEIGAVTDIQISLGEVATNDVRIPVFIAIDIDQLTERGAHLPAADARENVRQAVERGLRAQLNAQSLLTGLLFVQLDLRPDEPAVFVLAPDSPIPEIPTIPTTLQQAQMAASQIVARLENVDLARLVTSLTTAVEDVDRLVNTPELRAAVESLPATMANLNQTITAVRDLSTRLDGGTTPLLKSLQATSERTGVALEQARTTLETARQALEPGSPLQAQLGDALGEMAGAARSVRMLADYLERNPSALLRGRAVSQP